MRLEKNFWSWEQNVYKLYFSELRQHTHSPVYTYAMDAFKQVTESFVIEFSDLYGGDVKTIAFDKIDAKRAIKLYQTYELLLETKLDSFFLSSPGDKHAAVAVFVASIQTYRKLVSIRLRAQRPL